MLCAVPNKSHKTAALRALISHFTNQPKWTIHVGHKQGQTHKLHFFCRPEHVSVGQAAKIYMHHTVDAA